MLGIDSEIFNQGSISKISASSHHLPLATKCAHTTKHVSILEDPSNITQNQYSPAKVNKKEKIKILKKKLNQVEKYQENMEQKLGGYVGILQKQLKKKEEHNQGLGEHIQQIKKQIVQSKNDVDLLLNYLTKRKVSILDEETQGKKCSSPQNKIYVTPKIKNKNLLIQESKKSPLRRNKFFIK